VDRESLIARKQSVRQQIERCQRQLEQLRQAQPPNTRRIRTLEADLERLMGEEYTLRLAIDRQRIS
jgi:prefoldin subunit 5